MIYIYVGFFTLLVFGGLLWYAANEAVNALLYELNLQYPAYFTGQFITFLQAIWHWFPLVLVFGGLLWVYVMSQRMEAEGYV